MEAYCAFKLTETQGAIKPRKKYRSAFLVNLFQALESGEFSELLRWSTDGDYVELHNPFVIAEKVFPKMYKHSNLSSFTRQLNMYQFQRVRSNDKTSLVFHHPQFRRGCPELMMQIRRLPVKIKKHSIRAGDIEIQEKDDTFELDNFESRKHVKVNEYAGYQDFPVTYENTDENPVSQQNDIAAYSANNQSCYSNSESLGFQSAGASLEENNGIDASDEFDLNIQLLIQLASTSQGFIEGSNLPDGFQEFRSILEKMMGFDEL